jgi:hypothetical protein
MQTDPASLDPEERLNKLYALLSAALGILSLFASILPACGGTMALAGIVLGILGRRSESRKTAVFGIALSIIGLLTAIIYVIFVRIVTAPN